MAKLRHFSLIVAICQLAEAEIVVDNSCGDRGGAESSFGLALLRAFDETLTSMRCEMTGLQLRMARTALGLTLRQAAELTGYSNETIVRLEAEKQLKESTHRAVRAAFEAAGVIFIDENGEGPGVRLRKPAG